MSDDRVAATPQVDPFTPVGPGGAVAMPIEAGDLQPKEGEGMVRLRIPANILVTLDPTDKTKGMVGGDRVLLRAGTYDVPASLADHWYVKAAGAEAVNRPAAATPEPEKSVAPPRTPEAPEKVEPQPVPGARPEDVRNGSRSSQPDRGRR
jgi:hypothetical protein